MKPAIALTLGALALIVLGAGAAIFLAGRPIEQPIAFNHRLHAGDLGMDCTDCHLYALTGVRATIPNIQVCGDCHAEAQTDSPEEARLVAYVEAGEPIPWRKVYWVEDDVYFSHRRHTAAGGIECERCHGPMRDRTEPVTREAVPVSMDACTDCHYETGASNDCVFCHR